MKRGYFVHEDEENYGFAVVANSVTHAKQLGAGELMCDWIDIRATWKRGTNVSDLPIGVIQDDILALRRGIYEWLEQATCDVCDEDKYVEKVDGIVVCSDCIDDKMLEYHIEVVCDA